ncbi:MAG: AraC family transcriptional regulator [Lachnospiraceae bacterium]|nr:AraC family transcriptional regulator [Lachnospiraceae bacterium]
MTNNRSVRQTEKRIDRIYAEGEVKKAGYVMPSHHCHPYFELFYIESGACRFFIENNMHDMHSGDFMLIPPQVLHYTRYSFGDCKRNIVFFREDDIWESVKQLLPLQTDFFSEMRIFQVPEAHREQIAALLLRMMKEEKIGDKRSSLMLQTLLQELFLLCSRECRFPQDMPVNIHTTDQQIVQAAQFISSHYMESITMADIAQAAGYSPNYLSRKFREAAGIGVHEYLVFIRLQHAALELITTDDSITEIALRCGFSDSNYFKDAFKKRYGVTPRAYRK